jgi:hypothetical protein
MSLFLASGSRIKTGSHRFGNESYIRPPFGTVRKESIDSQPLAARRILYASL